LEPAAVLELAALGVLGAIGQARFVGARPTRAGNALLSIGAGRVEARQQAIAVDADSAVRTLEVELTVEGLRIGIRLGVGLTLQSWIAFEGIQA
jgi:hypothetical protein